MEGLLKQIGIPVSFCEALEDNYIFTEEDLQTISKEDLEEIFDEKNTEKILQWQKGGSTKIGQNLKNSPKSPKSLKKTFYEEDSSENEDDFDEIKKGNIAIKDEKIAKKDEKIVKEEKNEKTDKKSRRHGKSHSKRKQSKSVKGESAELKTSKKKKKEKSSKKSHKKEGENDIDKNNKFTKTKKIQQRPFLEAVVEQKEHTECRLVSKPIEIKDQIILSLTMDDLELVDKRGHKVIFQVVETFHNQKFQGHWTDFIIDKKIYGFSDKSGEINLNDSYPEYLKHMGICCSKWRWISQWIIDDSKSKNGGGWEYAPVYKNSEFDHFSEKKNDVYRRKRMFRFRALNVDFFVEQNEIMYKCFSVLIKELIIKIGIQWSIENNLSDYNQSIEVYKKIFSYLILCFFEKDVFTVLNSDEVKNKLKESKNLMDDFDSLYQQIVNSKFKIKDKFDELMSKMEELIDNVTIYRSKYKSDKLITTYLLKSIFDKVKSHSDFFKTNFFDSALFFTKIGYKIEKPENRQFYPQPLKQILKLLTHLLRVCKNLTPIQKVYQLIEDDFKQYLSIFEKCVNDFYKGENLILHAEILGDILKSIVLIVEIKNILKLKNDLNPKSFIRKTISETFKEFCNKKRIQYPQKMSKFIEEDWIDYGNFVLKALKVELDSILPNVFIPGIYDNPGENTLCHLISNYVIESNKYYSKLNPIRYVDPLANTSFLQYDAIKKFLSREKILIYVEEKSIKILSLLFINYVPVFENEIKNFFERFIDHSPDQIKEIKKERKIIHKMQYENTNGESKKCRKFLDDFEKFQAELFKRLANFILEEKTVYDIANEICSKTYSILTTLLETFFKISFLKKNVLDNFLEKDKTELKVEKGLSVAKKSDILQFLMLCDASTKIESAERTKEAKNHSELSGITMKLCIYFNNYFIILNRIISFKEILQNGIVSLTKKFKTLSKIKIDWPMKKWFEVSDKLLEFISLRVVFHDCDSFFHKFGVKNSKKSLAESELTINLALINSFCTKENFYIIIENVSSIILKTIEWILLASDRTFKVSDHKIVQGDFEKVMEIIYYFLPDEKIAKLKKRSGMLEALLRLMRLSDSDLLSKRRALEDKGVIEREFLGFKLRNLKSSKKAQETEKVSLTNFFDEVNFDENVNFDKGENEKIKKNREELAENEVKLSGEEKNIQVKRMILVISRRATDLCRQIAKDKGVKVPVKILESEGEENGEAVDNYKPQEEDKEAEKSESKSNENESDSSDQSGSEETE